MPMTNPGGGASSLSQLTDVNVRPDLGADQNALIFNSATGKWIASQNLASVPNVSAFSATDKSANLNLTVNNTVATSATATLVGVRGNTARQSGKYYLEFTIGQATTNNHAVGFASAAYVLTAGAGANTNYCFLRKSGFGNYNNSNQFLATSYVAGNVVSCAIDFANNAMYTRVNGGNWNGNVANNPATNTGGWVIPALTAQTLMPLFNCDTNADACTINCGENAFSYAMPAGFQPWDIFAPYANTVPASPAAFTAPSTGMYAVNGGTVSAITLTRGNSAVVNLGAVDGSFSVSLGDVLTVTYTVAPTVTFVPLAD